MEAMVDLGYDVTAIETEPEWVRKKEKKFFYRLLRKILGPLDLARVNQQIINNFRIKGFDIVWLDKGLTVDYKTLKYIKDRYNNAIIVGYSPDDMYRKHNQSRRFLKHLSLYDIFFTTKSYNVTELKELGCRNVKFIGNAFDLKAHRPIQVTPEERYRLGGPVGFIGSYEKERALSMWKLAERDIPVRVWGPHWNKCKLSHVNLRLEKKGLWGEDYAKAICSFDINLCFLRKINRDLQTTRSIEIPACGAFMLAERTDEHLELFEEGKEAEFFSSDEELEEKVRYYLSHPKQRERIAAAGRERCLKSGYSNHDRMRAMLNYIHKEFFKSN